jgi:hypothetical protein
MKAGYDPFRGRDYPRVEASIVDDYVTLEKWIRALAKLGYLSIVMPSGVGMALDDIIHQEAKRARADVAPLNATRKVSEEWMTDDVEDLEAALLIMGSRQRR